MNLLELFLPPPRDVEREVQVSAVACGGAQRGRRTRVALVAGILGHHAASRLVRGRRRVCRYAGETPCPCLADAAAFSAIAQPVSARQRRAVTPHVRLRGCFAYRVVHHFAETAKSSLLSPRTSGCLHAFPPVSLNTHLAEARSSGRVDELRAAPLCCSTPILQTPPLAHQVSWILCTPFCLRTLILFAGNTQSRRRSTLMDQGPATGSEAQMECDEEKSLREMLAQCKVTLRFMA